VGATGRWVEEQIKTNRERERENWRKSGAPMYNDRTLNVSFLIILFIVAD